MSKLTTKKFVIKNVSVLALAIGMSGAVAQDIASFSDQGRAAHARSPLVSFSQIEDMPVRSVFSGQDGAMDNPINRSLGSVANIMVGTTGQAEAFVIEYGGFAGLFAKDIALSFDNIDVSQQQGELSGTVNASIADFEGIPEFDPKLVGLKSAARETAADGHAIGFAFHDLELSRLINQDVMSGDDGERVGMIADAYIDLDDGDISVLVKRHDGASTAPSELIKLTDLRIMPHMNGQLTITLPA